MSEVSLSREPLWASLLEGEWIGQVQMIDTDEFVLCIFNSDTEELVYSEPTTAEWEPGEGGHVHDVVRWQERLQELVEERPNPWNPS